MESAIGEGKIVSADGRTLRGEIRMVDVYLAKKAGGIVSANLFQIRIGYLR